ncbi:MAG: LysR family transcriptional regulator [Roseateles depolymerans]|uniref:LysR family transcriptional regulator n=1 Tax=Roseateles depolymerans TaxID=76731 RepID=A0A2W5DN36_9BURK|nr:MAG: LysR family transcriptional regulator [Roseateles depolymerans]
MDSTIAWEWYRSLLAVLDEGSLSGAARALGLTQPTVGRHMAALEAALGQALFTRSPGGLLATDAARALRPYAEAMQSSAAALERVARSPGRDAAGRVRGVVRVTASEVVGVEVLPPLLTALRTQHPELTVELVLSNRVQDLLRREADIAVRMTPPQQDQLVARRVGAIELGLHAHADYLARHGAPGSVEALAAHALIGFDQPTDYLRRMARQLPGLQRERFALRTDSDLAQLALIRAGAGLGMCQVPLARRDPALRRVLPEHFQLALETWVTLHEDLRDSPPCRVTLDALVQGLGRYLETDP